ncbi:aldo/keto reductase [Sphingomonas sp. Leaf37]|uniref:aldo/keto reductase n=1 Tax=Sphingomonas sp. Leaf37 TaxID=2876552 RepID=UPI001E5B49D1|nr:aldo/keto reductase [Sphingomonas sp. Leaf37]
MRSRPLPRRSTSGLRHVDVAALYGRGLAECRAGKALSGRTDVMLSTKVGRLLISCASRAQDSGIYVDVPDVRVAFDYSYDGVMRSYEASLKRLGRAVDILYVHDVDASAHGDSTGADARIAELVDGGGWRALIELRAAGDVRAIGAGVNEVRACLRLLEVADPDLFLLAGRLLCSTSRRRTTCCRAV